MSYDLEQMIIRKDSSRAFEPTSAHLVESFKDLAHTLSAIGASVGIQIRAYKRSDLPCFSSLSLADQQEAVMQLAQYVSICQDVIASGGSLLSSPTFVWRAFKAFGLVPDSQLFSVINDDDIIEIYNTKHTQIFRNFRFFEFCSYTLEDLFSKPWHELFVRDEAGLTQKILDLVGHLVATKTRVPVKADFGVQRTREQNSDLNLHVDLEMKHIAVLFNDQDEVQAFFACERAQIV